MGSTGKRATRVHTPSHLLGADIMQTHIYKMHDAQIVEQNTEYFADTEEEDSGDLTALQKLVALALDDPEMLGCWPPKKL